MMAIAGMMSHRFLLDVVHPAVEALTITPMATLPMYAMRIKPTARPTTALVGPSMIIHILLVLPIIYSIKNNQSSNKNLSA